MKKKLFAAFFFFLLSVLSFSAQVKDARFHNNIFLINLNARDGEFLVSADEESRLIYIEIQNLDSSSFEKFTKNLEYDIRDSNLFEDVIIDKTRDSVSLTLQVAPKVGYVMDAINNRIEVNFHRTSKNKHLIVLDPGHGGKDPGAMRGSVVEKKIVLSVGTYLKEELSKDFNDERFRLFRCT